MSEFGIHLTGIASANLNPVSHPPPGLLAGESVHNFNRVLPQVNLEYRGPSHENTALLGIHSETLTYPHQPPGQRRHEPRRQGAWPWRTWC